MIKSGVDVNGSEISKIKYLMRSRKIKRFVDEIKPDIVNAHYATSYGTATAVSGVKDYILSVWGSDIYDFPTKSFLHKAMLKFSLSRAKYLFSTSKAMAEEASKYTNKQFYITPFGVDMDLFSPHKRTRKSDDNTFVVGTVKALTPKYGIDYLLKAIALVRKHHPEIPIVLRIAGRGTHELEYKELAKSLKIDAITTWLGFISQEQAAVEWANMDIGIIVSTSDSESFGVAAVEAQACGTPVIISDIPGLMEATDTGETSFVVPRKDEKVLADGIVRLYKNQVLRATMGEKGREYVVKKYELNLCFEYISSLFSKIEAD